MSETKEINFENTVFDYLKQSPLYTPRLSKNFNTDYALDTELLEQFIRQTQPDKFLTKSQRVFRAKTSANGVNRLFEFARGKGFEW